MKIMDCLVNDLAVYSLENWVLATADAKLYIAMKKGLIDLSDLKTMDPSTWIDRVRCIAPVRLHPGNLWPRALGLSSVPAPRWRECVGSIQEASRSFDPCDREI